MLFDYAHKDTGGFTALKTKKTLFLES